MINCDPYSSSALGFGFGQPDRCLKEGSLGLQGVSHCGLIGVGFRV